MTILTRTKHVSFIVLLMKLRCNPKEARARIVREASIVILAAISIICGNENERAAWWLCTRLIKWWKTERWMKIVLGLKNSHAIKEMKHLMMKKPAIFLTN